MIQLLAKPTTSSPAPRATRPWARALALAVAAIAMVALVACDDSDSGQTVSEPDASDSDDIDPEPDASDSDDDDESPPAETESQGDSPFGEEIEADDLLLVVEAPYRLDGVNPTSVRVDFTVEAPAGEGSEPLEVPAPTLRCGDDEVEMDHDVANFPFELDPGSDDRGTCGWTPTGSCERGSFEVGDVTFEFDAVPLT